MSARTKSRARNGSGHSRPVNGSGPLTMKAWSGYDGSNFSTSRGYVYFPTLDTRRDLSDYSLRELTRKGRWLYINSGFATRCIDGPANMAGSLTPVPQTIHKEWNALALASFVSQCGSEVVFDVSGKFNFWSCQPMLSKTRMLDGRALAVLTESESKIARLMFYEGHQLTNGPADAANFGWNNGVRSTKQNRITDFRLADGDPVVYGQPERYVTVPAADVIYHCEFRRPGRDAGEPVLRHAINHLLDRAEIFGYLKLGAKNAAQIGYQITKTAPTFDPLPDVGNLPRGTGAGVEETTLADGSSKVRVEDAYKGGKITEMDPGEEIKMLLDQRPHPNQIEFLDHLVREISWGLGCSPDILWNIAKLGGATARYVMADAQQTLVEPIQQLLADQFCSRFYVYYIAKELKRWQATGGVAGLPPCSDPEWWKHSWQPQAKMTVDIARDGKLYLDMHKAGLISLKRYFGSALGAPWQPETDDYLDERAYIVQGVYQRIIEVPDPADPSKKIKRPMTMEEAFPPAPGVSNSAEDTAPGVEPSASANTPATATP